MAAAIYTRISLDQDGEGLGVERQRKDCQGFADRLGWPVAEVYSDNDISAHSGKKRPAYERLLADLRAGRRDAVLVYHMDRLTRRPLELEQFFQVCQQAKAQVRFVAGDADFNSGDGLLMLRMLAAVAASESDAKSRRVARKALETAEKGQPTMGGSNRPYGYKPDRVTVDQVEAQVIRDMAARFIAGESLRSLCTWLNDNGYPTSTGGEWATSSLGLLLKSARIAGLRSHRGQVIGPAVWEAIITEEQREAIFARIEERKITGRRTPRRYVLSGKLRCHKCGGKLFAASRRDRRRYVCLSGPDHGGCGGCMIEAEPVEELVCQGVLLRLTSPALMDAMAGRAQEETDSQALVRQINEDQDQLNELAAEYAQRHISAQEWRTAREIIDARMTANRRQLAQAARADALNTLDLANPQLAEQFASLDLSRQAEIVAAVLDHAVIGPGRPGAQTVDPNRVRPVWRL